jgi:hypothetical protein
MQAPEPERYLIGTRASTSLAGIVKALQQDPDVSIIRVIGSATAPTMLVAEMPPERADRLKKELGNDIVIERDAKLSY